jgi:hypothetical protein
MLVATVVLLARFSGSRDSKPPAGPSPRSEAPSGATSVGATLAPSLKASSEREAAALEALTFRSELGCLSGVVVDLAGNAIEGAHCQVMKGGAPAGFGSLVFRPMPPREVFAFSRTDSKGSLRIPVPAGFWTLRVESEGKSPWEEAYLQAGDFRWIRLGPARDLTVRVLDEGGNPVADAAVGLTKRQYCDPREASATGRSNTNGLVTLRSIPEGSWFVQVSHAEFAARTERAPVGAVMLEVRLERGIRIVGRVTTPDGRPPATPARVRLEARSGLWSSHEVACDGEGRYASSVAFAREEVLEVAALAAGYGEVRRDVSLDGVETREHVVDLELDTPERTAVGRVVDADGRALDGVEVYLKPLALLPPETLIELLPGKDHAPLNAFDPKESWQAQLRQADSTSADGTFRVSGLSATKPYLLLLLSEIHSNATLWIEIGEPGSVADLGTVRLGRAGPVFGHVRRPDGTPIEGTEVRSAAWTNTHLVLPTTYQTKRPETKRTELVAITNEDGAFRIEPFPEGEFHLMCLGTLFGPYSVPLSEPIEIVTEDVERRARERQIPIRLTVMDDRRLPVASAYAQLRRERAVSDGGAAFSFEEWASWTWDVGDEEGRVELDVADAGTYRVDVKDVYGQLGEQSFFIELDKEGASREVILRPSPNPSPPLAGEVRTSRGEPLAGLEVTLIPDTGDISCTCLHMKTRTDSAGAFSFGFFMNGNHRMVVTDPESRRPAANVFPARPGEPIVVTMD